SPPRSPSDLARPCAEKPESHAGAHPPQPPTSRSRGMARSVYVTSPEGHTGKSSIALGLLELFSAQVRVGVFRPIARADEGPDSVLELLLRHDGVDLDYEQCIGVTYDDVHADPDAALDRKSVV